MGADLVETVRVVMASGPLGMGMVGVEVSATAASSGCSTLRLVGIFSQTSVEARFMVGVAGFPV